MGVIMNTNHFYEQFLEQVYELADHPAQPDTYFISNSPNLDEDFINSFISAVEQEISDVTTYKMSIHRYLML